MAAIVLSALLVAFADAPATLDKANEFAADLAADLSSDRADQFLRHFSKEMSGYGSLEDNVEAMLRASDVSTSLEIREFKATAKGFTATIDWYLEMKRRQGDSQLETQRRRELITVEVEKQGRRWRITKLDPASFFQPPGA